MVYPLLYSLVRFGLDVIATNHGDQAKLQAEVLALRRQVQVFERQIKRVHWGPGDRLFWQPYASDPAIGVAGPTGEAGDGDRLAPRISAPEVGCV